MYQQTHSKTTCDKVTFLINVQGAKQNYNNLFMQQSNF